MFPRDSCTSRLLVAVCQPVIRHLPRCRIQGFHNISMSPFSSLLFLVLFTAADAMSTIPDTGPVHFSKNDDTTWNLKMSSEHLDLPFVLEVISDVQSDIKSSRGTACDGFFGDDAAVSIAHAPFGCIMRTTTCSFFTWGEGASGRRGVERGGVETDFSRSWILAQMRRRL